MALSFPNTPTLNQTFTANNVTWRWTGTYWKNQGTGASLYVADTAPANPSSGTMWFESATGKTYVYYKDADSSQWVELGGSSASTALTLGAFSTTDLAEGSNLYFTTARATAAARAAITVSGSATYNSGTGVLAVGGNITSVNGQTGSVVLNTSNIAEDTSLYFTPARARSSISVSGPATYDTATGVITVQGNINSVNGKSNAVILTTSDIPEGTNQYFTTSRARAAISASGIVAYDSSTGIISLTTGAPRITNVVVTNSDYTTTSATAMATDSGGYIKIIGTDFVLGSQAYVNTTAATSTTFVSSTEVRAQIPALSSGTYIIYLVAPDGGVAMRLNAVTFSITPIWNTSGALATTNLGKSISIQLSASSDSSVVYSLASGSTLPPGLTLSSSGLLSGTVTSLSSDTTYSFVISATDAENQVTGRTFSITITTRDDNFLYVPLLLEAGASSTRSTTVTDSSTNNFTVTRNGIPSTGWVSPYQTDGYWGNFVSQQNAYLTFPLITLGATFTIEGWFYATAITSGSNVFVSNRAQDSGTKWVGFVNSDRFRFSYGGTDRDFLTTINTNTWYHFAFVVTSSTVSCYLNGLQIGTTQAAPTSFTLDTISGYGTGGMIGYLSNFRIVNGVAVYTGTFTPSTIPLQTTQSAGTNISVITGTSTSLLTCQSNRFKDNSSNNITITPNGAAQVTPYYYPGGFPAPIASIGAAYFNGSPDYVSVPNTAALQLVSSLWTIEGWFYLTSGAGTDRIFVVQANGAPDTNINWSIRARTTNTVRVVVLLNGGSSNTFVDGTTTINLNTWYHVAATCDGAGAGANLRLWVNGNYEGGTIFDSTQLSTNAAPVRVMSWPDNSLYTVGYASNIRILKGVALYTNTAAISVPTVFLTPIANTVLLLNFADSNYVSSANAVQNNTFVDTGPYALSIVRGGTPTQGSTTPYWPRGQWSNYFNGTTDYLSNSSSGLIVTASTYTVEGWIYLTSNTVDGGIIANGDAAASPVGFNIKISGNKLLWGEAWFTQYFVSTASISFNQWTHFACVKTTASTNGAKIYINGGLDSTGTLSSSTYGTTSFVIGRQYTGQNSTYFNGYISNLRVVSGVAVYTGNFVVPTALLQKSQSAGTNISAVAVDQTVLLTCQSNRFVDNSNSNFALAVNGSPQVQSFQPFVAAASYSPAVYGGGGYLNGSTDYLSLASNPVFGLGTGDLTIELWCYAVNAARGVVQNLVDLRPTAAAVPIAVALSSTGYPYAYNGTTYLSSVAIASASWNHIALVRSGTASNNCKLYLNGVQVAQFTDTGSWGTATTCVIGKNTQAASEYFNGYYSDIRIVKGSGVYTAAFTPPTAPVAAVTNTSLLINFANAAIYDASTQNSIITSGSAQSSTTQAKWQPASMRFNGTTDYLTAPINPALAFGSGDFTVEFWLYANAIPTNPASAQLFDTRPASTNGAYLNLYLNYDGTVRLWVGGADRITSSAISSGLWYYVALVRNGAGTKLCFNGTQTGATYADSTVYLAAAPFIGASYSAGASIRNYFNGYIQDFRATAGVGRVITTPNLTFFTR